MGFLASFVLVVQIVSAVGMAVLILLQHGKGADMGAAFGSGTSGSLFGAAGSANFLSRTTAIFATVFFVCTLALARIDSTRPDNSDSVLSNVLSAPAAPAASGEVTQSPAPAADPATNKAVDQIPTK